MSGATCVIIFGPPAVGKMTVGMALSERTGMPLLHNHMTLELVCPFFPFGDPSLYRLSDGIRHMFFEEVAMRGATTGMRGMIFTFVWALCDPEDDAYIDGICDIFAAHGGEVCFVELRADQEVRLERNRTPLRLEHKRTKRDVAGSTSNLLRYDRDYRLHSTPEDTIPGRHIIIDNTDLSPDEVAAQICAALELPTRGA